MAVGNPHATATGNQRGQVLRPVGGTAAATIEHEGVVEQRAFEIPIAREPCEEVGQLLT
jgi:hypothetical protein